MSREINILMGDWRESDKDLFFGPLTDEDEFFVFDDVMWPVIMATIAMFSSRSNARKNGWNKPVEPGYRDFRFGGKKHRIAILNVIPELGLAGG